MKSDKVILAAILVLAALVCLVLYISINKDREMSKAIDRIDQSSMQKPEAIDYDRISDIIKQQISDQLPSAIKSKDGQPGANGVDGISTNGTNGKDGESVYDLWLEAGNVGTLKEFLESLKGEKGDTLIPTICSDQSSIPLQMKFPSDIFWQVVPDCRGGK